MHVYVLEHPVEHLLINSLCSSIKIVKSVYENNIESCYCSGFHKQIGIVLSASCRRNT